MTALGKDELYCEAESDEGACFQSYVRSQMQLLKVIKLDVRLYESF